MKFYILEPQIPGGFGPESRFEQIDGRRILTFAQFIVDTWPDPIFENVSAYAVSDPLQDLLINAKVSGVDFRNCELMKGVQFAIANPGKDEPLPKFHQMIPTGTPRQDDIAKDGNSLVVSERVKAILDEVGLTEATWE